MNKVNTKYLYQKYPDLFRKKDAPKSESLMCYGFGHDDGWFEIIKTLCGKLKLISDSTGMNISVEQVKEKFGTLRFYAHYENKDVEDYETWWRIAEDCISKATEESSVTCERCGKWGEIRDGSWVKTLCDSCHQEDKK